LVTVSIGAPAAGCAVAEPQRDVPAGDGESSGEPTATAGDHGDAALQGVPRETVVTNAECPETSPQNGEACVSPGMSCGYGDCGGDPVEEAICEGGRWEVLFWSCNPPPCPEARPLVGDSCEWAGQECFHDDCGDWYRCVDGAWEVVGTLACNPPNPEPALFDEDAGVPE